MVWLEAALGFIGLVMLLGATLYWFSPPDPPVVEEDLAAPYREGLHAAMRLQSAARDLEQKMYTEAMRHAEGDTGGES
jgi:hypothetical protein